MFKTIRDTLAEVVNHFPAVLPHLSRAALKAAGGYQGIRDEYFIVIYDAVQDYLESDRPITSFSNAMREAMALAFTDTVYMGYEDAGAELPLDDETAAWLADRIAQEREHIVDLFARLKEEADPDPIHEANARATGYTATLDALYSEAKLRGGKNKMGTWHLGATEEHCPTCSSLDGQRHRVKWFFERNYIPRKPGAAMDCHGYNCDCGITDDFGNEIIFEG